MLAAGEEEDGTTGSSFVQFLREAKLPTSVTANIQPNKDLQRTEHLEMYIRAFRNILKDLRRAGYKTDAYDQMSNSKISRLVERELYDMRYETYEAMPSKLDMMLYPLHQVVEEVGGEGPEPESALDWRERPQEYLHLKVDSEEELPPRIYVHFACFPESTVFKEKQYIAVTNNLTENCGVTPQDTIVIITHNAPNATLKIKKNFQSHLNMLKKRQQGNFIINIRLAELQFDLQEHVLVPPARVLHRQSEVVRKLRAAAHIERIEMELPEIDVDDPQIRRLFARPKQVVEFLDSSENELDLWKYYIVKYPSLNY